MRHLCRVSPDRFQLFAWAITSSTPPIFPGYRVVRDSFIYPQTRFKAYARMREYISPTSGVRIFLQYRRLRRNLPPFKLTVIPDDRRVVSRAEIRRILKPFLVNCLLLVEVAFDFERNSGVTLDFVRRCALFGKSRRRISRLYPLSDRYGGRKSDKLVRCYWKNEVNAFRIEVELHSAWLHRYAIRTHQDFERLPGALFPRHFRFARVDWVALKKYLSHRGLNAAEIIARARAQSDSIHSLLRFLRTGVSVLNAHRFLRTLKSSQLVKTELEEWLRKW